MLCNRRDTTRGGVCLHVTGRLEGQQRWRSGEYAGAPRVPQGTLQAPEHGREVLLPLQAVTSNLSPGVEGFWIVFVQLVGAGIDYFVIRQTVLSSAGRPLVLQRSAADLWGLQCSLPLVAPSSGPMLSCMCQADVCWTLQMQLQLEAVDAKSTTQSPLVHQAGSFASSSTGLTVQASV